MYPPRNHIPQVKKKTLSPSYNNEETILGDGALTGQWVAVTHCNELGEDKKKKEEQHGILGDVIDPAMQWPLRASPTSWIFP